MTCCSSVSCASRRIRCAQLALKRRKWPLSLRLARDFDEMSFEISWKTFSHVSDVAKAKPNTLEKVVIDSFYPFCKLGRTH